MKNGRLSLPQPQFTGVSISNSSLHRLGQKLASIHANISRLFRLPLNSMNKEIETCAIEQLATLNGLHVDVRKLIQRKSLRQMLTQSRQNPGFPSFVQDKLGYSTPQIAPNPPLSRFWLRLPYLVDDSHNLARELRKYGY